MTSSSSSSPGPVINPLPANVAPCQPQPPDCTCAGSSAATANAGNPNGAAPAQTVTPANLPGAGGPQYALPPVPEPAPVLASRNPAVSSNPVRYFNGEIQMVVTDFAVTAFGGPWGHTRGYSNQLSRQDTGTNGNGWLVEELPLLSNGDADPENPDPSAIALVSQVSNPVWFDYRPLTGDYRARYVLEDRLEHLSGLYKHTDMEGRATFFYDFTVTPELRGRFVRSVDRYGHVKEAAYHAQTYQLTDISQTGPDGETCRLQYEHLSNPGDANFGQLSAVTCLVRRPSELEQPVRRVEFEYFLDGDPHGSAGDLKFAILYGREQNAWVELSRHFYCYYTADAVPGFRHGLKFAFQPEAFRRLALAVPGYLTAPDAELAPFADHYFEFDNQRRVTIECVNGDSEQEFAYAYTARVETPVENFNVWQVRTLETLPDGHRNTVYTNYAGQVILRTVHDVSQNLCRHTYYRYGEKGRVILTAQTSAIETIDESDPELVTLKSAAGFIRLQEYYGDDDHGPGAAPGYFKAEKVQQGENGAPILVRCAQYVRPNPAADFYLVSQATVYPEAASQEGVSTLFDYVMYPGTNQVRQLTVTLPAVPLEQNGSGVSDRRQEYYDIYGQPLWTRDERGIITGFTFDLLTGGLRQRIDDADAASNPPWTPLPGARLNAVTEFTGDDLGRMTGEIGPEHEIDINGIATPNRRARWIVYQDADHQQWEGHEYLFDLLGRLAHDRLTNPGTADPAVRRLSRTYNVRGQLETLTSWSNVALDAPDNAIVNQVALAYNDFGQLLREAQSHHLAVEAGTLVVGYAYADGLANTMRRTAMTYPNGRVLASDYGLSRSLNDRASRIAALLDENDNRRTLAAYAYLGADRIVEVTEPLLIGSATQILKNTLLKQGSESNGDGGDLYTGLDRFGRIIQARWRRETTDLERVQYAYDRASNRVSRRNVVAGTGQDEAYAYDDLFQVTALERGTLSDGNISNPDWQELFQFDPTGNWHGAGTGDDQAYITKLGGAATLKQNREHNQANEMTSISEDAGYPHWAGPAHDLAGNLTAIPRPASPTDAFICVWDAWNRLVKVKLDENTVLAEYAYDALHRRVKKMTENEVRHFYYSDQWQVLEERVNAGTTADRQFVWGQRGIDDLIFRDRDTTGGGTLDERLYALHDAMHVTGIVDAATGQVLERYGYNAFGQVRFLDASFSPATPAYVWETLFDAYRWDAETGLYHLNPASKIQVMVKMGREWGLLP